MSKSKQPQVVKLDPALEGYRPHVACPCTKLDCQWHGRCFECVLIHRVSQSHLPQCLQPIVQENIRQLAAKAEMTVALVHPASNETARSGKTTAITTKTRRH